MVVIFTKMVNKSHYYCSLIFAGSQGAQKQVTLKQEGEGWSGSLDWSPQRASGCPKVTQPVCTGADMSPQAHLGPPTGGFVFCLVGMTSPQRHLHRGSGRPSWPGIHPRGWAGAGYWRREVLLAASVRLGVLSLPGWERVRPFLPHVDVTGFLPSLSLPPSFSAVSVNLCATPCAPLPSPTLRLSGAPHSSAFPSRLVLPAFSLSAPGGRYKAGPSLLPNMTQGEGAALASGP